MNYYYLISSLPYLKLDEKPLFGLEKYLSDCAMWLNEEDFESLRGLRLDEPFARTSKFNVQKKWKEFETNLRNELVNLRIKNRDADTLKFKRQSEDIGFAYNLRIKDAFADSSPLGAEKKLISLRWDFLGSMEEEDYFGFTHIAVYYLKLKLLERLLSLDRPKGEEYFTSVYSNKTEQ